MKKFLMLFIALLAMTVPTEAQLNMTPIEEEQKHTILRAPDGIIPSIYSFNGEGKICQNNVEGYLRGLTEGTEYIAQIYDQDFELQAEVHYASGIVYETADGRKYSALPPELNFNDYNTPNDDRIISCFSQTLFNDDSDYEYIIPIFSDNFKTDSGYKYRPVIGFQIVNMSGKVLFEDKFDKEYNNSIISAAYHIGSRDYICVHTAYYSIDRKTSSLKRVEMPKGLKAIPGIARRDMDVKVEFEASATERLISLVDANGRTVKSNRIPAGTNVYNVNTGSLASGLYIVTLSDGVSSTETAKIIIR